MSVPRNHARLFHVTHGTAGPPALKSPATTRGSARHALLRRHRRDRGPRFRPECGKRETLVGAWHKGRAQYEIPRGLDLDRYSTVVIWCRAFSANFARAPLR